MAINKISNETIKKLREKSVERLPNVIKNISPNELKKRFSGLVIDSNTSIVDEINRIVDEINLGNVSDEQLLDLLQRLGINETKVATLETAIENIEVGVSEGVIKLETLEEANASPKAQKAGSIAFIKM